MSTIIENNEPPNKVLVAIIGLAVFFVFAIQKCTAQQCRNIMFENIDTREAVGVQSGACNSPDGIDHIITYNPSSYQQLQDSGYCYTISPVKTFTACYTFTAPSPSISLNTGYSSNGCNTISFSNINLYSCSPSCVLIGSGTTFTNLITGNCYTWCFSGKCTGIFATGFDHLCPYYQDLSVLPIELLAFKGDPYMAYNQLEWITATEINCKGYILETSKDCLKWLEMAYIECSNTSMHKYSYKDNQYNKGLVYYRLKQVDFNGNINTYKIIYIISKTNKVVIKITNELNEDISSNYLDYQGVKLIYYSDGSISKVK